MCRNVPSGVWTMYDLGDVFSTTWPCIWRSVTHTESPGFRRDNFLAPWLLCTTPKSEILSCLCFSITGTVVCKQLLIYSCDRPIPKECGMDCQTRIFSIFRRFFTIWAPLCASTFPAGWYGLLVTCWNPLPLLYEFEANPDLLSETTTSETSHSRIWLQLWCHFLHLYTYTQSI